MNANRLFPNSGKQQRMNMKFRPDDGEKGKLLPPEVLAALTGEIPFNSPPGEKHGEIADEINRTPQGFGQIQQITPEQQPAVYQPTNTIGDTQDSDILQNSQTGLSRSRDGKLYPNLGSGNTSADIQSQIQELGSADMGRENSFKSRLLSGLFKGIKAWGESGGQGGLASLAGAALTGGIGSAASPGFHGELRRNDLKSKLYGQLGQTQKQEEFQANLEHKRTVTNEIKRKPEKEAGDREAKFALEAKKQLDRIQTIIEKDRLAGKNYKVETRPDGRLVKKYPDREEPFLDGNGEQQYNLLEKPEEVEVADGKNPDGSTRYRKVFMKGGQYANLKSNEAYRDAVLGLSEERLAYQKKNDSDNDNEVYKGKVADLSGKIAASTTRVQSLKTELTRIEGLTGIEKLKAIDQKSKLQKDLIDAESELTGYQQNLQNLPKPTINGRYSGKTFPSPSALRSAFPNKTEAEIRQIIESNGGKFQQ